MKKKILLVTAIFFIFGNLLANEVNIFSARHYDSDVQLYEKFTAKTGIKVNVVSGKSGALEKRIIEEGADSKAVLYITADAGRLGAFAANLQGGLASDAIKSAVPSNFRTSKWVGIAKRARIVYFAPERVTGAELAGLTYESLADPKWKGRLVIRASNNIYNQSLVASLIKNNGKAKIAEWSKGMVSNMARSPKGNDRAQILAVAAGEADIAVAITLEMGAPKDFATKLQAGTGASSIEPYSLRIEHCNPIFSKYFFVALGYFVAIFILLKYFLPGLPATTSLHNDIPRSLSL